MLLTIGFVITFAIIGFVLVRTWNPNKIKQTVRLPGQPGYLIGSDELRIENVGRSGVLSLRGVGADLDDQDVTITARHLYVDHEETFQWFELEGDTGTKKVWLNVECDDETEVSVTLAKFHIRELGVWFNPSNLPKMAREGQGKITYEGEDFFFDTSGRASFCENGDASDPDPYDYWDFVSESGERTISIERWSSTEYECHLSQVLRESQIEVYANRQGA